MHGAVVLVPWCWCRGAGAGAGAGAVVLVLVLYISLQSKAYNLLLSTTSRLYNAPMHSERAPLNYLEPAT